LVPPETHPKKDINKRINDMTKENLKLFTEYLEYERLRGHTEKGFKNVRNRTPRFIEYVEGCGLRIADVQIKDASGFQGWLIAKKLQNASVVSYISPAVAFCEFLRKRGVLPINPFKMIRRVQAGKKLPRNIPKENTMEKLLDSLARYDLAQGLKGMKTAYRAHVAAELLYSSGIRKSEAAGIKVEDIDFNRGLIYINEGKGGTSRIAYISTYARDILKLYVTRIRPFMCISKNSVNKGLLFNLRWECFGAMMNKALRSAAKKLKLRGITCHTFRHAVGYHLLRAGCPIRHIQEVLGHKNMRNTEIYTKVDRENLRSVLDEFHPRSFAGTAGNARKRKA
jgi:integrase/recombinase XerD